MWAVSDALRYTVLLSTERYTDAVLSAVKVSFCVDQWIYFEVEKKPQGRFNAKTCASLSNICAILEHTIPHLCYARVYHSTSVPFHVNHLRALSLSIYLFACECALASPLDT